MESKANIKKFAFTIIFLMFVSVVLLYYTYTLKRDYDQMSQSFSAIVSACNLNVNKGGKL